MSLFDKFEPVFKVDKYMKNLLNDIDSKLSDIKISDKQKRKYMVTKSKVRSIHSSLANSGNEFSIGDNIIHYISLLILSIIVLFGIGLCIKKKRIN